MVRLTLLAFMVCCCVRAEDNNNSQEFTAKESAAARRFFNTLAGRKVAQSFTTEVMRSKFREDCLMESLNRQVTWRMKTWANFYHLMHEEVSERDAYLRGMKLLKM